MAEALAIQAACEGHSRDDPRGLVRLCEQQAAAHGGGARSGQSARQAHPGNLCAEHGRDPAAVDRWRAVVASFEAAPPSRPGKPDWGHVEALTMLGETYLQRGDPVAARDALERALVLAPDYRQAQQLLQAAAARPR